MQVQYDYDSEKKMITARAPESFEDDKIIEGAQKIIPEHESEMKTLELNGHIRRF